MSIGTKNWEIEAIAIGRFDGLHLGHQSLLSHLGEKGALVVIQTDLANLTPFTYRERHTSYPIFTYALEEIKELTGGEFISRLIVDFPSLKRIVVGDDFHFGKDRGSNSDDLQHLFGGEVIVVREVCIDGMPVHAKTIRRFLLQGEIQMANRLLGYSYEVCGEVIKGQGLGRNHFVPTLNLDIKNFLLPASGIYVTRTSLEGVWYPSVSFIGHRLSTDGNFCVETHVLDKEIEAPQRVCLSFEKRIRENRYYENFEALKGQIDKDIQEGRLFFKAPL